MIMESYIPSEDIELMNKINNIIDEAKDIETSKSGYWAGCNYYVNDGTYENAPIGTAYSMHNCDECPHLTYCIMKKLGFIWVYNEEDHNLLTDAGMVTISLAEAESNGVM